MTILSEKIAFLNQVSLVSVRESSEAGIVEKFTLAGKKIFEADFGFAWVNVPGSENFILAYKCPDVPYQPLPPRSRGLNFSVMTTREPLLVADINMEESIREDARPYMQSVAIIPMVYKDNIFGNILFCFKKKHEFTEEEKDLCMFIGNGASQAIAMHRLIATEESAKQEALSHQNRFKALIENSYDAIVLIGSEGQVAYVSPSTSRISGYGPEELMGKKIEDIVFEEDKKNIQKVLSEALQNHNTSNYLEFRYKHKDGSWRWMESTWVNMLKDPSVHSIVGNARDITERKIAEETIKQQALQDPLTSLPNRQELDVRLHMVYENAKRYRQMFAVLFVDLDRLKNINDTLGHNVGDTLLKVVAARFVGSVRGEDTVARLGGDEFVILLSEIHSAKDAVNVVEKILKTVRLPVQISNFTLHPTVSIGVAIYPHDSDDAETLLKYADIALYKSKQNGRNRYTMYDETMDRHTSERYVLENELRQALVEGQILLHYQPIINLKTNRVSAVEALARWNHPTRGLLNPHEFIPLAEETGLILALDEYVLKQACLQHKFWQSLNLPKFRIAVNVSAQQFSESNFIPQLDHLAKTLDLDLFSLDLEITETLAMSNLELTTYNLKSLKKMGIHITLDDFGTGYSSLSYLKRFPINNLKIDKSFVRQCITNEQDASIIRTIIAIAHNLDMKVIAEGVETDQQLKFLENLNCNAAQGFLINRPMPAENIPVWFEERLKRSVISVQNVKAEI